MSSISIAIRIGYFPDWILSGLYFESGLTATRNDNRPELQRLLKDCLAKRIDLIVTKSISRFSRNTMDCLSMIRTLRDLHVDVYFEKENINTGNMEGELFLSILSSIPWPRMNHVQFLRTVNGA